MMQCGARCNLWMLGGSIALLALTTGCVAESCETETGEEATCIELPTRYRNAAEVRTLTETYFAGTDLVVDGIYGEIRVFEGQAGRVSARFAPFAYGSKAEEALAFERLASVARMDLLVSRTELTVRSDRTDDELPLVGIDMEIGLPPEFDGQLVVTNHSAGSWNPGDVDLDFVGGARSIDIQAGKVSSCSVEGSPSVFSTYVRCWSDISVYGVNDDVDIVSEGQLGDVVLELASISAESLGGNVAAGGDVAVIFPAWANFSAQARAEAPGSVDTSTVPAECSIATAAETAKSLTCGVGAVFPNYVIDAGGSVTLGLQ